MKFKSQLSSRLAVVVMSLLLVPALAEAQTKVKSGFNLFSPEQDVQIGQQSAAQADQQLPMVRDSRVQSYVEQLGARLAAQAPGPKFPYRFRVVNASDINAFALPGGYVYVNRGVLESARDEGEVAGVLAHEIAHVALRHGTHNASKAYLTQAGVGILGGILGGHVGAGTAQIINAVGGIGLNALFLRYSREAESDADVLGSQIMARAGYSPQDMINFFDTLARSDKSKTVKWLSDHPAPADRSARIRKEAAMLNAKPVSHSEAAFRSAKSTLQSMPAARTTQQISQMGAAPSQQPSTSSSRRAVRPVTVAAPSAQMRVYTNRGGIYQLQYPANWQVVSESATGVTIAPPGGAGTSNGTVEVAYGAVINHYAPSGGRIGSAEDETSDLISQIQQSGGYQMVGSGSRLRTADGGVALAAVMSGTSRVTGAQERLTIVTRQLDDGHLVYMIFVTPEQEAQRYSGVLNAMVGSLRVDEARAH